MRSELHVPQNPLLSLVSVRSTEAARIFSDEEDLFRPAAVDVSAEVGQRRLKQLDWTAVGAAAFVYAIAFAAWLLLAN